MKYSISKGDDLRYRLHDRLKNNLLDNWNWLQYRLWSRLYIRLLNLLWTQLWSRLGTRLKSYEV